MTNDFPPKVGGIQQYLWEVWRRLDPETFVICTGRAVRSTKATGVDDTNDFDAAAAHKGIRIVRLDRPLVYLPSRTLRAEILSLVSETGANLVLFDPVVPLGLLGPGGLGLPPLGLPYGVVLHGAEVTVPGRLPVSRMAMARVLQGASVAVCAGGYPEAEAARVAGERMPPVVQVPPGVDTERFVPLRAGERRAVRRRLGLPETGPLVVSVSRLVPRKGMDVLIDAARLLAPSFPDLRVAVAGTGRDRERLAKKVALQQAPVTMLGRVSEEDKIALLGAADLFVMACRNRWGGLEQEGFGIVFVEAAASGVPSVAGGSGGAADAVEDGVTGFVVDRPEDPGEIAQAMRKILADPDLAKRMGRAARSRAVASFDYDRLAPRLGEALDGMGE